MKKIKYPIPILFTKGDTIEVRDSNDNSLIKVIKILEVRPRKSRVLIRYYFDIIRRNKETVITSLHNKVLVEHLKSLNGIERATLIHRNRKRRGD